MGTLPLTVFLALRGPSPPPCEDGVVPSSKPPWGSLVSPEYVLWVHEPDVLMSFFVFC